MTANVERLTAELQTDRIARDFLQEDNKDLQHEIKRWEKELNRLQKEDPSNDKITHIECEGYHKYIHEVKVKEHLKKQIASDKEQLRILRDARTDITEMNLDNLSQPELIRIVKQLERRKIDLQSKLRETENSLDTTAKEVEKMKETRKMYQTEIELRERKRGH